jgi:hypothetical protein
VLRALSCPAEQELIAFLVLTVATNWRFDGLYAEALTAIRNVAEFKDGDIVDRVAAMFQVLSPQLEKTQLRIEKTSTVNQGSGEDGSSGDSGNKSSWMDEVAEAEELDVVLHPVEIEAAIRAAGETARLQIVQYSVVCVHITLLTVLRGCALLCRCGSCHDARFLCKLVATAGRGPWACSSIHRVADAAGIFRDESRSWRRRRC